MARKIQEERNLGRNSGAIYSNVKAHCCCALWEGIALWLLKRLFFNYLSGGTQISGFQDEEDSRFLHHIDSFFTRIHVEVSA
jgi:hypothetical protein